MIVLEKSSSSGPWALFSHSATLQTLFWELWKLLLHHELILVFNSDAMEYNGWSIQLLCSCLQVCLEVALKCLRGRGCVLFLKSWSTGMSKPDSQDPVDNHGSSPQLSIRSTDPCPAGNMYFHPAARRWWGVCKEVQHPDDVASAKQSYLSQDRQWHNSSVQTWGADTARNGHMGFSGLIIYCHRFGLYASKTAGREKKESNKNPSP